MTNRYHSFHSGENINCDVCIIGAGAAGISIARELADSSVQVCLLESGSFEFTEETQELYSGSILGLNYFPLDSCRLRFFGGSTNHWNGLCLPLEKADFKKHSWIRDSGWPISYSDIAQYYEKAHTICELGPFDYDPKKWVDGEIPEFDPNKMKIELLQNSPPTLFGDRYRRDLIKAQNIRIVLEANLINLESNAESSFVKMAYFKSLDGRDLTVSAKRYILACGGIENARILLNSKKDNRVGLGNKNDLVGRYFMEHIVWPSAAIVINKAKKRKWWMNFQQREHKTRGVNFNLGLSLGSQVREREKVLNALYILYPHYHSVGSWSFAQIKDSIKNGRLSGDTIEYFKLLFNDSGDAISAIVDKLSGKGLAVPDNLEDLEMLKPVIQSEQAPNKESRVVLTGEKDRLGLNKVGLNWKLGDIDKKTMRVSTLYLSQELGRMGLGWVYSDEWLENEDINWPNTLQAGNHHMGTTRMSRESADGVVNQDCKVHGIANLFIAGSSVFPTGGAANPTLTIVALSIRLAQYLKKDLAS